MSDLDDRLRSGDAADERTLPPHARYRDPSRHVRFDECDRTGRMRAASVLRHAQDLAWMHSDRLEFSREWYHAHGVGWVVRAIDLIVDDLPGPSASLVGTTALVGFRHVMARRRTRLFDAAERVVADATIDWVMVDRDGRPTRFPPAFEAFVAEVGESFAPTKIPSPHTGADPASTISLPLRFADIDPLGHVNNAAWLELVDEALAVVSPEVLTATRRRIRLEYLGITDATSVVVALRRDSTRAGASVRVDASDPAGMPLLRGIVDDEGLDTMPHSRHDRA